MIEATTSRPLLIRFYSVLKPLNPGVERLISGVEAYQAKEQIGRERVLPQSGIRQRLFGKLPCVRDRQLRIAW